MQTATISKLKNKLSAYIDLVKHGETVLIVDRHTPVAVLESSPSQITHNPDLRIKALERKGIIKPGRTSLPGSFFTEPLPRVKHGASTVQALIADREEGR